MLKGKFKKRYKSLVLNFDMVYLVKLSMDPFLFGVTLVLFHQITSKEKLSPKRYYNLKFYKVVTE
jgi:hypothetical protein